MIFNKLKINLPLKGKRLSMLELFPSSIVSLLQDRKLSTSNGTPSQDQSKASDNKLNMESEGEEDLASSAPLDSKIESEASKEKPELDLDNIEDKSSDSGLKEMKTEEILQSGGRILETDQTTDDPIKKPFATTVKKLDKDQFEQMNEAREVLWQKFIKEFSPEIIIEKLEILASSLSDNKQNIDNELDSFLIETYKTNRYNEHLLLRIYSMLKHRNDNEMPVKFSSPESNPLNQEELDVIRNRVTSCLSKPVIALIRKIKNNKSTDNDVKSTLGEMVKPGKASNGSELEEFEKAFKALSLEEVNVRLNKFNDFELIDLLGNQDVKEAVTKIYSTMVCYEIAMNNEPATVFKSETTFNPLFFRNAKNEFWSALIIHFLMDDKVVGSINSRKNSRNRMDNQELFVAQSQNLYEFFYELKSFNSWLKLQDPSKHSWNQRYLELADDVFFRNFIDSYRVINNDSMTDLVVETTTFNGDIASHYLRDCLSLAINDGNVGEIRKQILNTFDINSYMLKGLLEGFIARYKGLPIEVDEYLEETLKLFEYNFSDFLVKAGVLEKKSFVKDEGETYGKCLERILNLLKNKLDKHISKIESSETESISIEEQTKMLNFRINVDSIFNFLDSQLKDFEDDSRHVELKESLNNLKTNQDSISDKAHQIITQITDLSSDKEGSLLKELMVKLSHSNDELVRSVLTDLAGIVGDNKDGFLNSLLQEMTTMKDNQNKFIGDKILELKSSQESGVNSMGHDSKKTQHNLMNDLDLRLSYFNTKLNEVAEANERSIRESFESSKAWFIAIVSTITFVLISILLYVNYLSRKTFYLYLSGIGIFVTFIRWLISLFNPLLIRLGLRPIKIRV